MQTLAHYQAQFIPWWDKHRLLHSSLCTSGRPLPDDRPYSWTVLQAMDDDVVLTLFYLAMDRAMPYHAWLWFKKHMTTLRLYHADGLLRLTSLRRAQEEARLRDVVADSTYSYFDGPELPERQLTIQEEPSPHPSIPPCHHDLTER